MTPVASRWPVLPLSEVAGIQRETIDPRSIPRGTIFVGLEHIEPSGQVVGQLTKDNELASTKFRFTTDHILYGKLRPYLRKIARPGFAGVCSTDIVPILPGPQIDRDYLFHFLRQPRMVQLATSRCTGANLPRLSPVALMEFLVPLPPLSEQKRIAAILDKADEIRRKRRQTLELADQFLRSVFLEMFGDPALNTREWPLAQFSELMTAPPRNGLSPSSTGTVPCRVLTLSAITGTTFDESESKHAMFAAEPGEDLYVDPSDFLVCRGNGNLSLVGRGWFPPRRLPKTIFPDTMIAARVDRQRITPAFLEVLWQSRFVRHQIESIARTTSGIHKINQVMLCAVQVIVPPRDLQARFEAACQTVARLRSRMVGPAWEDLLKSLSQRAFNGSLVGAQR